MRAWFAPTAILIAALAVVSAPAFPPAGDGDALEATRIASGVEQTLLDQSLREYESLARRRDEVISRMVGLQQTLDAAVGDEKAAASGRLDQLIDQVDRVNGERATLYAEERVLLERISQQRKRITLLAEQIAVLEGRSEEEETGALTGSWDIRMMPSEQHGSWSLKQDGAVVSGTYQLAGGWTGSLQGTLVDRKVYLVRIDSKLGKMMEFEGYLSRDGQQIRGTWLNYELAGSEGSTGQWSAQRRATRP